MLKKTITYENIDGNMVTKDFYFHITQAEFMEMMMTDPESDPEARLRRIMATEDKQKIMSEFKALIEMSVGRRTDDGDFIKTPQFARSFMSSEPYSELFQELMGNTDKVTEFINGLVSKKIRAQALAEMQKQGTATVVELPNSGVIEGVAGDAAVQAEKPQPNWEEAGVTPPQPTFGATEAAIRQNQAREAATQPGTNEDPPWLREMRAPTKQELMKMGREEMQLAFKMRDAGLLK
jgi:hypothetical protein